MFSYEPDCLIANQGDSPEEMYFVLLGKIIIEHNVIIHKEYSFPVGYHEWEKKKYKMHRTVKIGEIKKGCYFGESALLMNEPRFANCISSGITMLLSLSRNDFLLLAHGKTFDV